MGVVVQALLGVLLAAACYVSASNARLLVCGRRNDGALEGADRLALLLLAAALPSLVFYFGLSLAATGHHQVVVPLLGFQLHMGRPGGLPEEPVLRVSAWAPLLALLPTVVDGAAGLRARRQANP